MAAFAAMAVQEKAKKLKDSKPGEKSGRTANKTGIPAGLKERMETASGISLSDVKIHYNLDRPAKVGALAYAQGDHVYMGRGQERYLPHELGHVIQQRMGIVNPTTYNQGFAVNDDPRLERQADEIGRGVAQRIRGPVGDGKASNIVQMTTIRLKEVKGKNARNEEIVGLHAVGNSKDPEDRSFGGFQGIQGIFANRIRPMRYIRNADIGWGTTGNVWDFNENYQQAVQEVNTRNERGENIEIHTRSQYQCAEPKAFSKILGMFKDRYRDSLQREIIKGRPAVKKYEENQAELRSLGADGTNISKEKINSFIGRLKFDPARNPDRQGENKTEPTCPVCQQWVNKRNRTIKSIMRV